MWTLLTVKVDPRMKKAIQKAAEKQFISMSAAIKQAIEKYLQDHGVNWREEKDE
jgi:predicted transcriptional regulator